MKKLFHLLALLLLLTAPAARAQTTLFPGDVAFVGYNSDLTTGVTSTNGDEFSFIALNTMAAGTQIVFTSAGLTDANDVPAKRLQYGEAYLSWTAPAGGVAVGTVVRITGASRTAGGASGVGTYTASAGTCAHIASGAALNLGWGSGGSRMAAFQTAGVAPTSVPTTGIAGTSVTFLAGFKTFFLSSNVDPATGWDLVCGFTEVPRSTLYTGLANGQTAVQLGNATNASPDNGKYTGTLTGTACAVRAAINTRSNWAFDDTNLYNIASSGYTVGTITVPPAAPTGTAAQTLPPGSTVASLAATGTTVKWYATRTFGTALASTTVLTTGTTYYATQTNALGCESTPRLAVTLAAPLTLTSRSPARNAIAAARTTNVALTFDQTLNTTTAGNARVFSSQRGGQLVRGGNASASGSTLTVNPANDLRPGETVFVTVPATVTSSGGGAATPQVYQFTAAAAPAPATFVTGGAQTPPGFPTRNVLADVNGDGALDVLMAFNNSSSQGGVLVSLNNGSGGLGAATPVGLTSAQALDAKAGDLDNDGDLDLVISQDNAQVRVLQNNGAGIFSTPATGATVATNSSPQEVVLADLDGDGDLDLAVACRGNEVSVRFNNGGGVFTAPAANGTLAAPGDLQKLAAADLDNDGDLDLAVVSAGTWPVMHTFFNNGSGQFTLPTGGTLDLSGNTSKVQTGDVDADGDADVLVSMSSSAQVALFLNNGGGTLTAAPASPTFPTFITESSLADLDGDGDLDLLGGRFDRAVLLFNNGSGTFAARAASPAVTGDFSFNVTGDLNGDGTIDVVAGTNFGGSVRTIYLNQAATPTLASLSPTSGPVGTPVTLTGSNLTGATAVTFTGTANNTVTTGLTVSGTGSSQTITVNVPTGAATGNVTVTTPGGTSATSANTVFTVLNQAPVIAAGQTRSVAENSANGTLVGAVVTASDPDAGQTLTYAITAGNTGSVFAINSGTGQLTVNGALDFEGTNSYALTVRVTDNAATPANSSATVTVSVSDVNEAPTALTLSNLTLNENNAANAPVGTFSTTDPDAGDTFTYALVSGTGSTDNALVNISGTSLRITASPDFETKASYAVRVRTTDAGNLFFEQTFTITVTDVLAAITNVSPLSGPPGTTVTITGTDLTGTAVVFFATPGTGPNGQNVQVNAAGTQVTFQVPTGALSGALTLRDGSNNTRAVSTQVFVAVPELRTEPTSYATAGQNVTFGGSNLANASAFTINGVSCPVVSSTATTVTLTIAATATTGTATVTTPGGSASFGSAYAVGATVSSFSPTEAPTGATVTVTGTGFSTGSFGSIGNVLAGNCENPASFALLSATSLSFVVPPFACTGGPVRIGGPGTPAGPGTFVVLPTLVSFSPASGAPGTVVSVTVSGNTNVVTSAFAFNGTPATTVTSTGAFTYNVTVPAGATSGPIGFTTTSSAGSVVRTGTSSTNFTVSVTDLTVSASQNVSGTYNSVTITGAGVATLTGPLTVNTALTVQTGGTLLTNCQALTGTASFALAAGATLGICDVNGISASGSTGAVQTNGPRSFSSDANYRYNGTLAQMTGTGLPATVRTLTTTNAQALTLTQPVAVAQVLTVGSSGNLNLNGHALLLPSSATGTALVVNAGTGVVSGTATVQRYINGSLNPGAGYRHFSAPVSNTTVADLATAGFAPVLTQSYNSSATPGTTTPFPTVFGYDQSRLTLTSNFLAFDKGFFVPQATDALVPGQGYAVHIGAAPLVDFVGTLGTGDRTVSLSRNAGATAPDAGWQLVGNPYPAPLDYSRVAAADRANLDAAIYVSSSTGPYAGQYRSYVSGIGNPVLPLGQGFFVRVSSGQTSGALTFRNSQRLTTPNATAFQRPATDPRPLVQLDLRGSTGPADALYAYVQAGATPAFDPQFDAEKLPNASGLNLSSTATSGQRLAIDGRPAFTLATVLPLAVGVPAAGTYTLEAATIANLPAGLVAYLLDAQTGTATALAAGTRYAFSVSAAQAAALGQGRFSVVFRVGGALAITSAQRAAAVGLYPNPAQTTATVVLPAGAAPGAADLVNALGQVVRRFALPTAETRLDLRGLATGVYVLRLSLDGQPVRKRLVID